MSPRGPSGDRQHTAALRSRIVDLYQSGLSFTEIGPIVGLSKGGAAYHYRLSGATRVTRADRAVQMRLVGMRWAEIAEELGYENDRSARTCAFSRATPDQRARMSAIPAPAPMTLEQRRQSKVRRERERRAKMPWLQVSREELAALKSAAVECPLCGVAFGEDACAADGRQFDHVIPINAGGPHKIENIRVICATCNRSRPRDGSDLPDDHLSAVRSA